MTTKTELENLVAAFEKANNRGSPKEANRLFPGIVRAIVDFVENPGIPYVDKTEWSKEEVRELAEALFSPPGWQGTPEDEALAESEADSKSDELLEDETIISRLQAAATRQEYFVEVGSMTPEDAQANLARIKEEIAKRTTNPNAYLETADRETTEAMANSIAGTCKPCTVTEENPNGVAENPFTGGDADGNDLGTVLERLRTEAPAARLTAAEAPASGAVEFSIDANGVPRGANGENLEALQDAEARFEVGEITREEMEATKEFGIDPVETKPHGIDPVEIKVGEEVKTTAKPKGKASKPKPEAEA